MTPTLYHLEKAASERRNRAKREQDQAELQRKWAEIVNEAPRKYRRMRVAPRTTDITGTKKQ